MTTSTLRTGLLSVVGLASCLAACAPAVSSLPASSAAPPARVQPTSAPPVVLATGPGTMAVRVAFEPREAIVLVEGQRVANPGVVILQSHPTRLFNIEAYAPGYTCGHARMVRGGFSTFEGRLQPVQPGDKPCAPHYYRDGLEDAQRMPEVAATDQPPKL